MPLLVALAEALAAQCLARPAKVAVAGLLATLVQDGDLAGGLLRVEQGSGGSAGWGAWMHWGETLAWEQTLAWKR